MSFLVGPRSVFLALAPGKLFHKAPGLGRVLFGDTPGLCVNAVAAAVAVTATTAAATAAALLQEAHFLFFPFIRKN